MAAMAASVLRAASTPGWWLMCGEGWGSRRWLLLWVEPLLLLPPLLLLRTPLEGAVSEGTEAAPDWLRYMWEGPEEEA